VIYTAQIR